LGDLIAIHVVGSRDIKIRKTLGVREILERLRKYRGQLPKDSTTVVNRVFQLI
jgi:hypothetical protein